MKFRFPSTHLELELLSSINAIAMFPVSHNFYQLINEKPHWLNVLGLVSEKNQLVLNRPENFLENFMVDARQYWLSDAKGSLHSGKWVQTDAQGTDYPFEAIASKLQGQPIVLVQLISDSYREIGRILQSARENAITREKIEDLVYKDDLTGLYNRRGFFLYAEEHLLAARSKQKPVTIACIDLDRLKFINDQYGHQAGDQTIVNAANIFKNIFRHGDILGRIGGDEFLALMISMDKTEMFKFDSRMNQAIDDWNAQHEPRLQLSFSIGLASDTGENQPLELLVSRADAIMYRNKQSKYQNQEASSLKKL